MKGLQLPLGVQLADTASFDTFHAGPNADTVTALRAGLAPLVLLFGPRASGKTHLLQALTREAAARRPCAYVPLAELARHEAADVLDGLEHRALVALDDLEAALGRPGWAVALLRLLDAVRTRDGVAVLSASAPPERLPVPLADLRTRLSAAAIYGLKPLTDADREQLLAERARARGLELPADAARYLLARLPRDAGSLTGALDRLDRATLTAQRRLTLAFVQQWLREQPASEPPEA